MNSNENKNENKNEQFKSLKEIDSFLKDVSKPFLDEITSAKNKVKGLLDKVNALKQEKLAALYEKQLAEEKATIKVDVVQDVLSEDNKSEVEDKVSETVQEAVVETPKPAQNVPTKDTQKPQTQTYINPDMVRRANGNREGGRPQFDKNRPAGSGSRPMGQGGPRPFGPKGRVEVVAPTPVVNKTDNKKKKDVNKTTFNKDEKKGMSKRDLLKRGYAYDSTLEDDSDTARYVKVKKVKKDTSAPQYVKIEHAVLTSERVPIKVFSEKIGKSATEIVKKLFDMGKFATINDVISFEEAELIAIDYDITLELKADKSAEDKLKDIIDTQGQTDTTKLVKRPPIVTIMGHVDHGKTSLLDYIRKANVAGGEAGGITQHIGAYTIDLNGEKITFLDTPGHEAFTAMRQRGANVTDIAVIVVAADDGIMPQTIEAIHHAKAANVSIIVAVNKIDKTDGNCDRIMQQLTEHEIVPEAWGGDTIVCPVSAKTGQGVKELLESILLVAEVNEYKANKKCSATGSILEASLDKGKGPIATILVQNGTLKVSDYVVAGTAIGKIRDMTDHTGKRVKEAFPSYAVQVQGFSEVPNAGDLMVVVKDEKLAKKVAQERADKEREELLGKTPFGMGIDDPWGSKDDSKTLNLIIKGDVQGSVEAVKSSLLKLNDDMADKKVKLAVVHSAVGAISESDIMLADTSKAIIIAFNVKAESKAQALAERNKIDIRRYNIIYDAINDMTRALKGMLDPIYKEVSLGEAEVRATFRISSFGTIAGSYVTTGKVVRNSKVRVVRDGIIIFEGVLTSLRREKDDVKEVASGYECGIGLEKFNDVKIGDTIESYILEQIEQ